MALDDDTRVYVGHDYPPAARDSPLPYSTVLQHRDGNTHVNSKTTLDAFVEWRQGRDKVLGQPRLLHHALQCNAFAGELPAGGFFLTPISGSWL